MKIHDKGWAFLLELEWWWWEAVLQQWWLQQWWPGDNV